MIKKAIYRCIFSFSLISIYSCSSLYYVPNGENVPLFKEKGEFSANLSSSSGDHFSGVELQGAYALTDHFGVQANGIDWVATEFSTGQFMEIAPGYFTSINDFLVFEIYGGIGSGQTFRNPVSKVFDPLFVDIVRYDRYFVQPAIGFTHKNIDFAFSARVAMVDFYGNKPYFFPSNQSTETVEVKQLNQFYSVDPALTFRFGWRHFKFQLQTVYLFPLLDEHQNNSFYEKINVNFGIHFNFGGHFRDSRKSSSSTPIEQGQ